ncbi:MAG TPA: response regulator [Oscillospiraceae bacterium]|nr:response regulator [Oscillospiraceae bacterium]
MYKVILIDDEDIIVEGLKKVVNWAMYGCEVVAVAPDAKSGAQVIRKHKPDILFTDIKMPNMDGLTMLAGLKGEFPKMQITVLTGYRDFEYATRAIQLGVTRFLLKPSKMNELEEALQVMTDNLGGLSTSVSQPAEENEDVSQEGNSANSLIVRSAVKYIEEHYVEKLTLLDLAEHTYVSQWYLSKLLNKYTGKSFCDLLNQIRVNKAEKLLQDPSLKIREISDLLGYNDVTHFSKIFKKVKQMSPNEYRNTIHN